MNIPCSNGRLVAKAICEKYNTAGPHVYTHPGFMPLILAPFKGVDRILFSVGIKANMAVVSVF